MKTISLIVAAGAMLFAVGGAEAMPAAPLAGSAEAAVTLVRGGCGFGAHQGPFGGCRLNNGPRGRYRAMMGAAPRGCRPGTHPTGRGFCRRNVY